MPSGPKKRMKLRKRKNQQQESPPTDANSDRETEGMSISESMDRDEVDTDEVDTPTPVKPGDRRAGRAFDDKEAVSSQTEEWVRVSDFDVGTPTSQTGENEPVSEDSDISHVRRSLDKLAEWETVSGDNIPGRKDGSINSLEEEPSEVDAEESIIEGASGHSSESFMHLPSPQTIIREKDSDMDRRSVRSDRSSSSSSSSSSDAHSKPKGGYYSTGVGSDINQDAQNHPQSYAAVVEHPDEGQDETITKSNGDPGVEKEIVHEGHEFPSASGVDSSAPEEKEMKVDEAVRSEETTLPQAAEMNDGQGKDQQVASDVVEENPLSSTTSAVAPASATPADDDQADDETIVETISASSPVEEKEITTSDAKDISEVATPLTTAAGTPETLFTTAETPEEDKQVLPLKEELRIPTIHEHEEVAGDDEKIWLEATLSGEKTTSNSSPNIVDVIEDVPSEDKEVASSLSSDDKQQQQHEETKTVSPPPEPSTTSVVDDKEVGSSSAETEQAKKGSADSPNFESATTILEKFSSGDHTELTIDSVTLKRLEPASDQAEQQAVVVERHTSVDTNQPVAVKNGIVTENLRPHVEDKSILGCCDVINWLLGRNH